MQQVAITLTTFIVKVLRYALTQLMKLDAYLHKNFNIEVHNKKVIGSTQKYDMVAAADESYYAEQYWNRIKAFLKTEAIDSKGYFLDLGCGQGRMSIPLAKWCAPSGRVSAIDLSSHAIDQARKYAGSLNNIDFKAIDLFEYLQTIPDHTFDGIIMLEVIFFLPNYEKALAEAMRVLKPGGFFIGSFRPQYFNLLCCLQRGLWTSIDTILKERSGDIVGGGLRFNWHTVPELKIMMEKDLNLSVKHISGIGVCSGIPSDPHAQIIRPALLTQKEQQDLLKAEQQMGELLPEAGRYILIAARKES